MDIQVIIAQSDLLHFVELAGSTVYDKGRGRWRCCCPLHGGHDPSGFSIIERNDGKLFWTCFSGDCGSGDVIDFVMKWQQLEFLEACKYLTSGSLESDPEAFHQLAEERKQRAEAEYKSAKQRLEKAIADLERVKVWEAYHSNLNTIPGTRLLWQKRGVPEAWQDIWRLGYTDSFTVWEISEDQSWQPAWNSPSLSIPIFEPDWKIATVRHRLLKPQDSGDKYRPERAHLKSYPFVADPDRKIKGPVLVVEGEIKGMVAFITADDPKLQVIGIPGKRQFPNFISLLADADPIYILPDPDGEDYGQRMAQMLGHKRCRIIQLKIKVDDAILAGLLDKSTLRRLIQFAPKV
jgi:hypothetical protein